MENKTSSDYIALLKNNNLQDLENYTQALDNLKKNDKKKETKNIDFTATTIIDLSLSDNFQINMIGDCKISLINPENGATYKIIFAQLNQGRHQILDWSLIKFPSGIKPSLSNSTNTIDILYLYCISGNIYGNLLKNFA